MLIEAMLKLIAAVLNEERMAMVRREFIDNPFLEPIDVFAEVYPELDEFAKYADYMNKIADILKEAANA